jgi:hypothetical protein
VIDPAIVEMLLEKLDARIRWDKSNKFRLRDRFFILPGELGTVRLTEYEYGEVELVYEGNDFCIDCGRGERYVGEEALCFLERKVAK